MAQDKLKPIYRGRADNMVDRVKPKQWVMPNRVGFPQWIFKTFNTDMYGTKRTNMFIQQRLVRDFLQKPSPYRGLLCYHGLGSGKTCSAIAATEAYSFSGRKVVIMLPAALAQNFQNELTSCGNLARWSCVALDISDDADKVILLGLKKTFHFSAEFLREHAVIDKNAPNKMVLWFPWIPRMQENGGFKPLFDTSRCIVKGVRLKKLDDENHEKVMKTLTHILPKLYTFIKYNGLTAKSVEMYTSSFFDNSIVVIDEAHNFISQSTHIGTLNYRLYQHLKAARNCRILLLSGTPAINHPIEIAACLNLLRGDMRVLELTKPASAPFPTSSDVEMLFSSRRLNGAAVGRYIDDVILLPGERKIRICMLPHGFIRKEGNTSNGEVENKPWGISVDAFEKRIAEMFAPVEKQKILHFDAYPKSIDTFNELFLDMSDPSMPKMCEQDLFIRRALGLVSFLANVSKPATENADEDAQDTSTYPDVLPERIIEVPMSDHQFEAYEKNRKKELEMEQAQDRRRGSGRVDPFEKVSSVYRAFSRMTCNFAFPKELNRPFPRDMRAAAQQIDVGTSDDQVVARSPTRNDAYEQAMQDAMDTLRTRSADYLTHDALMELYSPKMARVLEDATSSPGKVLFYSQFRTVEGVGIFRQVLLQAGWVEIVVGKMEAQWRITGLIGPTSAPMPIDELFAPAFNKKRFIIFNSDREKTEVLMRIFNGQLHMLPPYLRRALEPYTNANLYGDICRMMMVTQSGSEGISLKHVRRVLILEPFWNKVRIDQVVGRAARQYSHTDLPPTERNVEVRIYTSVFTPEQIAKSFTIATHERGISSDTHIASRAASKDRILGEFLTCLKRAAIDCTILAKKNQATHACYSFPRRHPLSDLAFIPDIQDDRRTASSLARRTVDVQVQGRIIKKNGVKVVVLPNEATTYDYDAYKHGKVLMPVKVVQSNK